VSNGSKAAQEDMPSQSPNHSFIRHSHAPLFFCRRFQTRYVIRLVSFYFQRNGISGEPIYFFCPK
jgi:hypothetical protein